MSKKDDIPKSQRKVEDRFVISSYKNSDVKDVNNLFKISKKTDKIHSKKLSESSKQWLRRQINDEYTNRAKELGYRSRASFKLLEIDDKFKIVAKSKSVLDLGSAPGGWTQVILQKNKKATVVAVDLIDMDSVPGSYFIKGDFMVEETRKAVMEHLERFDLIVSDIAPNTTGDIELDHMAIMNVATDVIEFVRQFLDVNGSLVMKIFMGSEEADLIKSLRVLFKSITYFKPKSSRKESKEIYLVCTGKI